jgi:hypothetical protein
MTNNIYFRAREHSVDRSAARLVQSECPGYCGAQDTFYVGTLKGVAAFVSRPSWILEDL